MMRALPALLGLPALNLRRAGLALGLLVVALVLAIIASGRLVDALERALLSMVGPAVASLLTGLVVLACAGACAGLALYYLKPRRAIRRAAAAGVAAGAGTELVAQLFALIRSRPKEAALIAVVAGFAAGAVPEARRILNELLTPQSERRKAPPDGRPEDAKGGSPGTA